VFVVIHSDDDSEKSGYDWHKTFLKTQILAQTKKAGFRQPFYCATKMKSQSATIPNIKIQEIRK
jgi:hypothetical protein